MSKEALQKQADRADNIADQTVDDAMKKTLREAAREDIACKIRSLGACCPPIYYTGYRSHQAIHISADPCRAHVSISDLKSQFVCHACGRRGATFCRRVVANAHTKNAMIVVITDILEWNSSPDRLYGTFGA
jgi:hypothetical protein